MFLFILLQEGLHPFARALADFLYESNARSLRPGLVKPFMRGTNAKYEEDMNVMMKYMDEGKSCPLRKNVTTGTYRLNSLGSPQSQPDG